MERQERQIERQLWAVIEMEDAGVDLEGCDVVGVGRDDDRHDEKNSKIGGVDGDEGWGIFGVWDVFWGVSSALAKGEKEARFEVRQLDFYYFP